MSTVKVDIPDIGDAKDVEVIEICVSNGDDIEQDDALIVIESDKASMEVPSPVAGKVISIAVSLGDLVNTGDPVLELDAEEQPAAIESKTSEPVEQVAPAPEVGREVLEPSSPPTKEARKKTQTPDAQAERIYAGPAVRRLARELGVDLVRVNGSGANGRIVKDDVKSFVKSVFTGAQDGPVATGIPRIELPDFSRFGDTEEQPLSRVQAIGAQNLSRSWLNVVHVTQHEEFDVTDLESFRADQNARVSDSGGRLSPLPFILKAVASTLLEFPQFNASIHPDVKTLIIKKFINLGMAVDTDEGLIVPVIRAVDKKGIRELSTESKELALAARSKRLKPDQIAGATFTVSSLGNIGGTGFTPVINAPEVAILGVARVDIKPVWNGAQFIPRHMLPVSLSYDHRAINGAEGGRFVQALGRRLSDIRELIL